MRLPAQPGSYILWFYLPRRRQMTIGRLGEYSFSRGWYAYCGSALGAGGLRARLQHHLRPSPRCHWHIDYFKAGAQLREIWLSAGDNHEHDFSRILLSGPRAEAPVPGFGSSDCSCVSHLVRLPAYPLVKTQWLLLQRQDLSRLRCLRIHHDLCDRTSAHHT